MALRGQGVGAAVVLAQLGYANAVEASSTQVSSTVQVSQGLQIKRSVIANDIFVIMILLNPSTCFHLSVSMVLVLNTSPPEQLCNTTKKYHHGKGLEIPMEVKRR